MSWSLTTALFILSVPPIWSQYSHPSSMVCIIRWSLSHGQWNIFSSGSKRCIITCSISLKNIGAPPGKRKTNIGYFRVLSIKKSELFFRDIPREIPDPDHAQGPGFHRTGIQDNIRVIYMVGGRAGHPLLQYDARAFQFSLPPFALHGIVGRQQWVGNRPPAVFLRTFKPWEVFCLVFRPFSLWFSGLRAGHPVRLHAKFTWFSSENLHY